MCQFSTTTWSGFDCVMDRQNYREIVALSGAISAWEHGPLVSPEQSIPTGRPSGRSVTVQFCSELAPAGLVSAVISAPERCESARLVSQLPVSLPGGTDRAWDLSKYVRSRRTRLWLSSVVWSEDPTPVRLSAVVRFKEQALARPDLLTDGTFPPGGASSRHWSPGSL